ncbi:hypothetical protein L465_03645 [Enterobacter sp. BIDMC 29]|uniref:ArsR/SmtB family transcription factor n=1 Tax=Enterobacter sp. BIDMC 29 TaxID=1329841 RepID=UPI00044C5111|nr:metalloregulator ArsR/SmtB family transcription factor [Enterobacter sp. BIDMC 29]EUM08113.1 hypothetical protein L465_03645 [Enterobacter sp. BIDMC 29]
MHNAEKHLYSQMGSIARLLGHAHRMEILVHLAEKDLSVKILSELTELSVNNISKHLQTLRHGNFVLHQKKGRSRIYRLADDSVKSFLTSLRFFIESGNGAKDGTVAKMWK